MKKNIITTISLLVMINPSTHAMDILPKQSHYYYNIGGGSDVDLPPPTRNHSLTVGGYANTNLDMMCTGYNQGLSITNTVSNLKDSLQSLGSDIVSSATAAMGSLAMYGLAKYNPELYNLIENAMAGGENEFNVSMKDCQLAQQDIKNGVSPYEDWFKVSDSQGWIDSSKSAKHGQDVDINHVVKNTTKNHRENGVPWVHESQSSGGLDANQKPIKVIYDIVVAGYNVYVDPHRRLDDLSPVNDDTIDLTRYWKSPGEAGDWARLVLGDITISAKEADKNTSPGVGLVSVLRNCPNMANNEYTCAKNISEKLVNLVQSNARVTSDKLKKLNSGNMMITPEIIDNIRDMNDSEKKITISKLSEDIAIQNLVDESLMLRRVLISGSQTKPVQNLHPALSAIQKTIDQLDQDVKNLTYEYDVRSKLSTHTLQAILDKNAYAENRSLINQSNSQMPEMNRGAIYLGGNKP